MTINISNKELQNQVDEFLLSSPQSSLSYVKILKDGRGFDIQGKIVPAFRGRIISLNLHLIRFVGNKPEKLPNVSNDKDIPAGFKRRCDLQIMVNKQVMVLPLTATSFRNLGSFLDQLKGSGKSLDSVLTEFKTITRDGNFGAYAVVTFQEVDLASQTPQQPNLFDPMEAGPATLKSTTSSLETPTPADIWG